MKRILVIDDSPPVRQTLAWILGQDHEVVQRPASASDARALVQSADLAIVGIPPGRPADPRALARLAAEILVPTLFLLDSVSEAPQFEGSARFDWLAKPFNPYDLRQKVQRLLAEAPGARQPLSPALKRPAEAIGDLDFPYLPKRVSAVARNFARSPLPVLIVAERGCGQERVAFAIHALKDSGERWIPLTAAEINRGFVHERVARHRGTGSWGRNPTLFVSGLESLDPIGQSQLWRFLEDEEKEGRVFGLLSTSQVDLLERIYRGEFLDALYYRLATLVLRIPPLRERTEELAVLAAHIVGNYAQRLGLGEVSLSQDALERIKNYLWFGNLDEMRAVLARGLASRRRAVVEGADLVFMVGNEGEVPGAVETDGDAPPTTDFSAERPAAWAEKEAPPTAAPETSRNGDLPDLRLLLNELAHEFKNPMVTIKTFAQLLEERFDDASFRARFQETVGNDIQRMNELLEVLLEFSRLSPGEPQRVPVHGVVSQVVESMAADCAPKGATITWTRKGEERGVLTDEAQFGYALRNVLAAALAQSSPGQNIELGVEGRARVVVSYGSDEERMSPLTPYLGISAAAHEPESLSLRLLLARAVLQRLGGKMVISRAEEGKVSIQLQLPEV